MRYTNHFSARKGTTSWRGSALTGCLPLSPRARDVGTAKRNCVWRGLNRGSARLLTEPRLDLRWLCPARAGHAKYWGSATDEIYPFHIPTDENPIDFVKRPSNTGNISTAMLNSKRNQKRLRLYKHEHEMTGVLQFWVHGFVCLSAFRNKANRCYNRSWCNGQNMAVYNCELLETLRH
jgi:hypothetical protein